MNIQTEVAHYLGRVLTMAEYSTVKALRKLGYANPIDIARKLEG